MDVTVNNGEELNHRFRGRFENLQKEKFFVEFGITQVTQGMYAAIKAGYRVGEFIVRIDHLFRSQFESSNFDPTFIKVERNFIGTACENTILGVINRECFSNFNSLELV